MHYRRQGNYSSLGPRETSTGRIVVGGVRTTNRVYEALVRGYFRGRSGIPTAEDILERFSALAESDPSNALSYQELTAVALHMYCPDLPVGEPSPTPGLLSKGVA